MIFRNVDSDVYFRSRCIEPRGHFRWSRGPIRHVQLEKARWRDGAFSRHDGVDERDRVPVSARSPLAFPYRRRHIAGRASDCHLRALLPSLDGILALDLRCRCGRGSVPECLCPGRTGAALGTVPKRAGADTIRPTVHRHATRRAWDLRRAGHRGCTIVSPAD